MVVIVISGRYDWRRSARLLWNSKKDQKRQMQLEMCERSRRLHTRLVLQVLLLNSSVLYLGRENKCVAFRARERLRTWLAA
jgi:hypothetical protein